MNEELQEALTSIINRVVSGADAVVEFSKEQVPDVLQQLLMWHMMESLVWCISGVLVLGLTAYTLYRVPKSGRRLDELLILYVLFALPLLAGIKMLNLVWLKVWLAPKLYLLEYAASLVK